MAFKSELAYTGIAQPTPPNQITMNREPTANDYQSFNIGDRWIVPTQGSGLPSQQEWILMSKAQNVAVWVNAVAGGAVTYNDHELLVGTGTSTINTIDPNLAGYPLISKGFAADPQFDILTVPGGGTNKTSFTAYSLITGGTISTNALQSVASTGVAGQVLHSAGPGALPVWQGSGPIGAITNINILYLTTPGAGTYTPTPGMIQCIVECVGGGAGSSGIAFEDLVDPQRLHGQPCSGAGYTRKIYTAADIGASQAYVVGAKGTGGVSGIPNGTFPGTSGANTTFMGMTAGGGLVTGGLSAEGTGGTATGGDINLPGQTALIIIGTGNESVTFAGGSSGFGYGTGGSYPLLAQQNGNPGVGNGGGGGACAAESTPPGSTVARADGGDGSDGIIIITEFIN